LSSNGTFKIEEHKLCKLMMHLGDVGFFRGEREWIFSREGVR
jgi:hypothetical protein